jgi:hypothetical protein
MDPDRPSPPDDRRRRRAPHPPGGHERRLDRPASDATVTLALRAHADGREIVVRRAEETAADGAPRVHIDAVVR